MSVNKFIQNKVSIQLFLVCITKCVFRTFAGNGSEIQWCFSQVKGTVEEDITEGKWVG